MVVVVTSSKHHSKRSRFNPSHLLALISLVFLILGGTWYGKTVWFIRNAEQVTGTVINLVEQGKGVTPLVKFKTSKGEEMRFKPHGSQKPSPYEIGDQVKVYYDADRPAHSKLDDFVSLWLGPLMFAIAAAATSLTGAIVGIIYKRHHKRYQQ